MTHKLSAAVLALSYAATGAAFAAGQTPEAVQTTGLITEDTTINVPSSNNALCNNENITTIQQALECLSHYRVASNATVTVSLNQEPTFDYQTIYVTHPDGDKIQIVGNCVSSQNGTCPITFASAQSGLVVQNGNKLGLFNNFILKGQGSTANNGILARHDGSITLGDTIDVSGFGNGIAAVYDSDIVANYAVAHDNTGVGIVTSHSSSVVANYANAYANGGGNFDANYGASLSISNAISKDSNTGIHAGTGAGVVGFDITSIGDTYDMFVELNASIVCYGTTTTDGKFRINTGGQIFGCNQ